jgi:Domain of unknown function (DUF1707)/Domain of unknown function (DUF4190)
MTPQWGHGVAARGNGHLRASTADRERAIEVLKTGFAEGRLTKDEYDDRVTQAYAARTYADLAAVTADLPGGQAAAPPWPPGPAVPPRTNPLAIASLVCGLAQPFTGGLSMIPAVILGHTAHSQIRRTGEAGQGLATAGLVLGWTGIVMMLLLITVLIGAAATLNI